MKIQKLVAAITDIYEDQKRKIDLRHYGRFMAGLTEIEINNYLDSFFRTPRTKSQIKIIRKHFNKIAGCNTCAVEKIDGKQITLMYRSDVERHAEKMFYGTPTFFD